MRFFRSLALAALLSLILTSAVQARPLARPAGDLFQPLWSALVRLWASTVPATKEGCGMDPLGRCHTASSPTYEGCTMDPLGCSGAAAPTEAGCGMDPLGCSGR